MSVAKHVHWKEWNLDGRYIETAKENILKKKYSALRNRLYWIDPLAFTDV